MAEANKKLKLTEKIDQGMIYPFQKGIFFNSKIFLRRHDPCPWPRAVSHTHDNPTLKNKE
jgi:hypothetical protein